LIESKFYRLSAHGNVITVPPLPTQFPEHEAVAVYGNKAEFAKWKSKDPVAKFRARLIKDRVMTEANAKRIEDAARAEVKDAVQFALASPLPAPEEAMNYVYA
jgi:pyruvate dehydrogenase E1 component alpha subunit